MKKNKLHSKLTTFFVVTGVFGLGFMIYFYGNYKTSREYYMASLEYLKEKNFYAAGECLEAAIYYDDDFAEAYLLLGKIDLEAIHDPGGSLNNLNKAIEYSYRPTGVMYFLRGKAGYLSGKRTKVQSKEDFLQALKLDPSIDSTTFYLAVLSEKEEQWEDADNYYSSFLENTAPSASVLFSRGVARYRTGNYKKALEDLNKGLNEQASGEMFYYRALCHLELNNKEAACTDFANAISADYEQARETQEEVCGQPVYYDELGEY